MANQCIFHFFSAGATYKTTSDTLDQSTPSSQTPLRDFFNGGTLNAFVAITKMSSLDYCTYKIEFNRHYLMFIQCAIVCLP